MFKDLRASWSKEQGGDLEEEDKEVVAMALGAIVDRDALKILAMMRTHLNMRTRTLTCRRPNPIGSELQIWMFMYTPWPLI